MMTTDDALDALYEASQMLLDRIAQLAGDFSDDGHKGFYKLQNALCWLLYEVMELECGNVSLVPFRAPFYTCFLDVGDVR